MNVKQSKMILICVGVMMLVFAIEAAPQAGSQDGPPMPHEYQYEVKDPEKNLFFNANENGDGSGKVTGGYQVLLPDGRLMKVEYTVEGESGFVPKISFEENAKPF